MPRKAFEQLRLLEVTKQSAFNDVARQAVDACCASVCVISIFGQDPIVVATNDSHFSGAEMDWQQLCNVAARAGASILIDDAVGDQRLADSRLLVEGGLIRAYAGARLVGSGGGSLGAICVADERQRRWSPVDRDVLERLARVTVALIESCGIAAATSQAVAEADARRLLDLRFRTVFNSVDEGLMLYDSAGAIVEANQSALRLLGLTEDQLLGCSSWRCVRADGSSLPDSQHPAMVALRTGADVTNFVMGVELPGGHQRWLRMTAKPLYSDDQLRPWQVLATFVDIGHARATEAIFKEAQRGLEKALEAAEAASKDKSVRLEYLRPEMCAPLRGLLDLAEALAASRLEPQQREIVSLIESVGRAVEQGLGELCDLAAIESGRFGLETLPFSLRDLFDGLVDKLSPPIDQAGLDFVMKTHEIQAGNFIGTPDRISQVLTILVNLAIRRTQLSAISVAAELSPIEFGCCRLMVSVSETAAASSIDSAAVTPDPRFQSGASAYDNQTARSLAFCRALLEYQGGGLSLEPATDGRTTFTFWLPLRFSAPATAVAWEQPNEGDCAIGVLSILVAEDHAINRRLLEIKLADAHVDLTFAEDGRETVELYAAGDFDVILMDIQLPVLNGIAAVRAIRELERAGGRARTPIAIMSADLGPERRREARRAGADGFINKSTKASQLIDGIHLLIGLCRAQ